MRGFVLLQYKTAQENQWQTAFLFVNVTTNPHNKVEKKYDPVTTRDFIAWQPNPDMSIPAVLIICVFLFFKSTIELFVNRLDSVESVLPYEYTV